MEEPKEQPAPTPKEALKSFSELVDLPATDRVKHELRILEGLMAQAVRDKDWTGSLKIFESAHEILKRSPPPNGSIRMR